MSEIRDSGEPVLSPPVQELVDLDRQRVTNFWSVVDEFSSNPIKDPSVHPSQKLLEIGSYAGILEGCVELYLRSSESMSTFQLDHDVDTITLFNAMENTRSALKRTMLGYQFVEGDPSLSELFATYRISYLPSLVQRTKNVFYGKSIYEPRTERDVEQAIAIGNFMGKAVVMPVVEASSALFEEVLRSRGLEYNDSTLGYFRSNLNSSAIRDLE